MKSTNIALVLLATALTAGAAQAADGVSFVQAPVLSATPIFETIQVPTSREVCWDEEVRYRRNHNGAPTLIGGVIGGAVGRQFGGGHGKDALTALGAIVGASIANNASRKRSGDEFTQVETRCRVAQEYYTEERITGYHVRYEYNGQIFATRTETDPGETLSLRVSVMPVTN